MLVRQFAVMDMRREVMHPPRGLMDMDMPDGDIRAEVSRRVAEWPSEAAGDRGNQLGARAGAALRDRYGAFFRLTQRRAGQTGLIAMSPACRPAAAHIRRQSSGMKERAIDTGPSC
jgi:hypothetical protein